jgi:hypothetical protein
MPYLITPVRDCQAYDARRKRQALSLNNHKDTKARRIREDAFEIFSQREKEGSASCYNSQYK